MGGTELINDIMNLKGIQIEHGNFGPWILFFPKKYKNILNSQIKTEWTEHEVTVRERILSISGIKKIKLI